MSGMVEVTTTGVRKNMNIMVYLVKNTREICYVPFLEEYDTEVIGY